MANPGAPSPSIPSFVCVLPCTKPLVKYLDRLDGCADGIHVTLEESQDLSVSLYGKMVDAFVAADDPPGQQAPDPCSVCHAPIVPRPTSPAYYLEHCDHCFHDGCLPYQSSTSRECSVCRVPSRRVLLWPELFATAAAKTEAFQLQKGSLGLNVAPQTDVEVYYGRVDKMYQVYRLTLNKREFILRPAPFRVLPGGGRSFRVSGGGPPTSYPQERCNCGTNAAKRRARNNLLLSFRCPFPSRDDPNGKPECTQVLCAFWHPWTQSKSPDQPNLREFPRFFCARNSVNRPTVQRPWCSERIRVHSQELVRCLAGFHPTLDDLKNVDAFAGKIANLIMKPVVIPEQSLVCAFCSQPQSEQANSVRQHLQNCFHWMHSQCVPLARQARQSPDPNRKMDLFCPTCETSSVRTIAWPGPFRSDMHKKTIFDRQMREFKLYVKADTQVAIGEVANQVNVFTFDYGGPSVVTIDTATAPSTILYEWA